MMGGVLQLSSPDVPCPQCVARKGPEKGHSVGLIECDGAVQYCECELGRKKRAEWLAHPAVFEPMLDRYGNPMPEDEASRHGRDFYEGEVPTLPNL